MSTRPRQIDPQRWEKFQGFRETFLMYFTDSRASAALRGTAALLYDLVLECYQSWPPWSESTTATELRAALADLRFLEGYFGAVGRESVEMSLERRTSRSRSSPPARQRSWPGLEMRLRRRWGGSSPDSHLTGTGARHNISEPMIVKELIAMPRALEPRQNGSLEEVLRNKGV